jgi:hypothetical protein
MEDRRDLDRTGPRFVRHAAIGQNGSCKERMRRSFCTLLFHHRDTGPDLIVRHVQAEFVAQHRSEFGLVL